MRVKWQGSLSNPRKLPGGGTMGANLGNWEFLSQTNNNANCVPEQDRFKFVDDLTALEIVNLLTVGLTSFNIKNQIPNDIPSHNQYIKPENLKSQENLNEINQWTQKNKMLINQKKSKVMIFNFTQKYQFTTRLELNGENLEVVPKTKLLGVIIPDDLNFKRA